MKHWTKFALVVACLLAMPAQAQNANEAPAKTDATAAAATPAAPAPSQAAQATAAPAAPNILDAPKSADWPQRQALAKKMAEIQPASQQVDQAIKSLAQQVPANDRAAFVQRISGAIDNKKLEQVSIDAMARTFTAAELQHMVDYFSTPEARSIAEKMPIYQQLVQPEIFRMMDAAVMKERTGAPGEKLPSPQEQNPAAGSAPVDDTPANPVQ